MFPGNKSNENIEITQEEARRITEAMKDPKFREMLADYMDEISDPKNKEEYNLYLEQLENQQELPKGMRLVRPKAGFCIKTMVAAEGKQNFETKLFINICSTEEAEEPRSVEVKRNGVSGTNWSVPYILGQLRYDQDTSKG
eukprot:TRINITY_DN9254_c0_g1_i4.p1 TRINITY_DN9254_c0_g1~~TRINITY_DN9254_c0_g1_i4.p1  ORF type:complete len:141 (-),score=38.76 TRINITY_DN9254_c0_g1_i4:607-1029(-)